MLDADSGRHGPRNICTPVGNVSMAASLSESSSFKHQAFSLVPTTSTSVSRPIHSTFDPLHHLRTPLWSLASPLGLLGRRFIAASHFERRSPRSKRQCMRAGVFAAAQTALCTYPRHVSRRPDPIRQVTGLCSCSLHTNDHLGKQVLCSTARLSD